MAMKQALKVKIYTKTRNGDNKNSRKIQRSTFRNTNNTRMGESTSTRTNLGIPKMQEAKAAIEKENSQNTKRTIKKTRKQ